MTTYRNTRNGKLAELIKRRDDGATMKMLDTGEEIQVGIPTLKRWWKSVLTEAQASQNEPVPTSEANNKPEDNSSSMEAQNALAGVSEESENTPTDGQNDQNEPETASEENNKPEGKKSAEEPVKLSEIARKLEDLFDILNGLYYEGKLPRPVITIQSTPKAYGHCSTKKIWKSENEARYEINIGAEFLNRPKENTAATLQHEMIHLYCCENNINETCQKGRYHNKTFKLEAEARGLEIGYDRANGYTYTTPTDAFKQKLEEAGFDMSVPFARQTILVKKTSDREKPHKYVCDYCGQTVRSTGDLNIVCGICDVPMTRKD